MRLLIVEDDPALGERLLARLKDAGYAVDLAADGIDGAHLGATEPYDAVVLDLGLPGKPGLSVLREWREAGNTVPVLILTARDGWSERVTGLQAGADDYLGKPFHFEELLARVQALLRRAGGWASPVLSCGPVVLDLRSQTVAVQGEAVDLTTFEYRLLEHLMMRAGDVISKAELTERLYEQDFERDSNTIEVFMGRLRRKLDPDDRLQPIETLRGRGYRFSLPRDPH